MKDPKEHLDIDLDFLGKKAPVVVPPRPVSSSTPAPVPFGQRYNWKKILIIGGVVLFFGWATFSDDSSSQAPSNASVSPQSSQSSDSDNVIVGEYRCSTYHYNQAVALDPDETEQVIDNASTALASRSRALDRLKDEIDGASVNEYSAQWEINEYNGWVDDYNSKLPAYERDAAAINERIDRFNDQVQGHNDYLAKNCTKR